MHVIQIIIYQQTVTLVYEISIYTNSLYTNEENFMDSQNNQEKSHLNNGTIYYSSESDFSSIFKYFS